MRYDSIIIGFGKAGKTLAATLAKKGEKVALIEKDKKMYGGNGRYWKQWKCIYKYINYEFRRIAIKSNYNRWWIYFVRICINLC